MSTYPSIRKPDHVYYLRDDSWWLRHLDAQHADAEVAYLLDVLVSVHDQHRPLVIADHEQAMLGATTRVYSVACSGRLDRLRVVECRPERLAESQRSPIIAKITT